MEGGSAKATMVPRQREEESKHANPMRLLTVSREGAQFFKLQETADKSELVSEPGFPTYPTATLAKFTPYSGRLAVIADPIGLHVVDCLTGKELRLILKSTAISALSFSPKDTYFVTCEKFVAGEKNLIVWDIATGMEVG